MSLPRWRENDKRRRQAIHAFIGDRRDELLKCIPKKYLGDANAKRNELVRLGRQRFSEQPRRVQERYLQSVTASTAKAGEEFVTPPQKKRQAEAQTPKAGSGCPSTKVARGPSGEVGRQHKEGQCELGPGPSEQVMRQHKECQCELGPEASRNGVPSRLGALWHGVPNRPSVELVMLEHFSFVQTLFPGALAFDVVAASIRFLELAPDLPKESDKVKAALILGVGAKLAGVAHAHTFDLWRHFCSPRVMPHMAKYEARLVAAWAQRGLGRGVVG